MQVWPAIDLRGGKCVRLRQGDFAQETIFGDDPSEMAARWVREGAERLHLVDLDGARDGNLANRDAMAAILASVSVPCQVGGGIRDQQTIESLLALGVARLVVGTQAVKQPDWFIEMCGRFPDRLALGIDARDGLVATDGWQHTSRVEATELARRYDGLPMAALIYTDISRDGMLAGPNLAAMQEMCTAVRTPVIASGGVTTTEDIQRLSQTGVTGCIIGRSLYEGGLTLADALAATR